MNHHIAITWAKRKAEGRIVGIGSYFATYKGVVIGEWRVPECSAARCHASHSDILVTTRNGRPAMSGNVGWLADHTVEEKRQGQPPLGQVPPLRPRASERRPRPPPGADGELVPHQAEQEAIQEMVALRAQGTPLRAIAATLGGKGRQDQRTDGAK